MHFTYRYMDFESGALSRGLGERLFDARQLATPKRKRGKPIKKEMKIMKEFYSDTKQEKADKKKPKAKKAKGKKAAKSLLPRNKIQRILAKNMKKMEEFFGLSEKSLLEMDFQKMANKLNTTKFLYKSRMVVYPVDLFLEIQRHEAHKADGGSG